MALEHSDVLRAAHLARLGLSDDEARHYLEDLGRILSMVDELQALDTQGVAPLAHPLDATQRLRADEVTETD
ncbi:Asp-tRNA(Asn)/Glu-tRNA(Gln) amidotransferase subunit GatC, partial [Halomonas sp.]|uniref:Asp-tRNA(Asn)/Glu-tRNA(Gln) amidotransferase subunit GatC n=1 Tax=Halomonas sp. TaxID=1486246 RepID=UPI003561BA72